MISIINNYLQIYFSSLCLNVFHILVEITTLMLYNVYCDNLSMSCRIYAKNLIGIFEIYLFIVVQPQYHLQTRQTFDSTKNLTI